MKVLDELYFIEGRLYDSNCYIIGDKALTLIDTGSGMNIKYIRDSIKKDGLDPNNIKKIILTHCHFDHSGGLNEFIKISKPIINISDLEAPFIEKADKKILLLDMFGASFSPVKVQNRVHNGQKIKCGKYEFEVINTPGHSIGSICLYEKENKILISGDTIFAGGSFGRVDLPTGSINDLINSVEKLSKLEINYLLPGHNHISKNGQKDIASVRYMLKTYY